MPAVQAKARPRGRRTESAEVRRRQLLEGAKRRFRAVGFHATTMAEVAAEAGVSVGLIYQHFASKEALIEGIILEDLESQIRTARAILDRNPRSMVEAIRMGARSHLRLMLDQPRSALMLEIAAETSRNPKIHAFVAETAGRIDPAYHRRIMALKPAGWTDETMLARLGLLNSMMRGAALQGPLTGGGPGPSRAMLRALYATALALFTPGADEGPAGGTSGS